MLQVLNMYLSLSLTVSFLNHYLSKSSIFFFSVSVPSQPLPVSGAGAGALRPTSSSRSPNAKHNDPEIPPNLVSKIVASLYGFGACRNHFVALLSQHSLSLSLSRCHPPPQTSQRKIGNISGTVGILLFQK